MMAALSSFGVIGPFFFENAEGDVETVNSDRYLALLRTKFLTALRRRGINIRNAWFQQDGAAPHTSNQVLRWLSQTFGVRFISFKSANIWPPHSPDLNL